MHLCRENLLMLKVRRLNVNKALKIATQFVSSYVLGEDLLHIKRLNVD